MRSIVAFQQGKSGPASFGDIVTEVRLVTVERSTLSERHARLDEHGNYTYHTRKSLAGPRTPSLTNPEMNTRTSKKESWP